MRDKFIKDESGFSLLEVVLSIGMLAFLSVFILQMFMVSAAANHRAKDIDVASYTASRAIEELKACDFAGDFFNTDFVEGTQVAFGLSDFFIIDEKLGFNSFDFSKGLELYKYYDSNWKTVNLSEIATDPNNPGASDIKFRLELNLSPHGEGEAGSGNLFDVSIEISSGNTDSGMRQLANYETKVYFANVGEIYGH